MGGKVIVERDGGVATVTLSDEETDDEGEHCGAQHEALGQDQRRCGSRRAFQKFAGAAFFDLRQTRHELRRQISPDALTHDS